MYITSIYKTGKFTNQTLALNESTIIHRMATGNHNGLTHFSFITHRRSSTIRSHNLEAKD